MNDDLLPAKYNRVLSAWQTAAENVFFTKENMLYLWIFKALWLLLNIYEHFDLLLAGGYMDIKKVFNLVKRIEMQLV